MRSIRNCLNKQLTKLCLHSLQLEELSERLAQLLPPDLAKTCFVGSFNKGCLILHVTDAIWASQLRYLLPELRDALRKEAGLYQLSSIKLTILENQRPYEKPKKITRTSLSEKAKASLISESQQCNYQPLKKALIDLAK